jgi:hypothetical protein
MKRVWPIQSKHFHNITVQITNNKYITKNKNKLPEGRQNRTSPPNPVEDRSSQTGRDPVLRFASKWRRRLPGMSLLREPQEATAPLNCFKGHLPPAIGDALSLLHNTNELFQNQAVL